MSKIILWDTKNLSFIIQIVLLLDLLQHIYNELFIYDSCSMVLEMKVIDL